MEKTIRCQGESFEDDCGDRPPPQDDNDLGGKERHEWFGNTF